MPDLAQKPTTDKRPPWPWQAAALLALVAALAGLIIGLVAESTDQRIHNNRQQRVLDELAGMLPAHSYDNNPALHTVPVEAPGQLQTRAAVTAYLATLEGQPSAVVYALTTHDGYSGDIGLLVAIAASGELLAVRVTRHQETPGIGDKIEAGRSDWLRQFAGVSAAVMDYEQQQERSWSSQFDQISGATITSSAVIDAVARISRYHQQHSAQLWQQARQQEANPA